MSASLSLSARLAACLPRGLKLQIYHISTPAVPTPALFAPVPGHEEEATSCESHFLTVSAPEQDEPKEVLVYAIEVLIFVTTSLTTLFVSKADSSGFLSRLDAFRTSPSIVATITATFIDFLLEPRLASPRVVVSLFARAQNQYLFPGSSENPEKHILDDRQLIKWWCRILDQLVRHPQRSPVSRAHLLVPGCDKSEIRAFFPPSTRLDPSTDQKWTPSYPVELLVNDPSVPPRHLVPRLPDDPKARFLTDLDGESVDEAGQWRSVKSLAEFWELMSYRQECSAGRLVGFVWVTLSTSQDSHELRDAPPPTVHLVEAKEGSALLGLATPANSQHLQSEHVESGPSITPTLEMLPELTSPPPSSPIQGATEPDSHKTGTTAEDGAADHPPAGGSGPQHPRETQGEVVLSAEQYDSLMDHLLQTDFAGEKLAVESSRGWVDKALEISKALSFGLSVVGHANPAPVQSTLAEARPSMPVTLLTGIRKKRKVDVIEPDSGDSAGAEPGTTSTVNTLSATLIRKKVKS
jgi:regulator of Ty1 transposition protein 109